MTAPPALSDQRRDVTEGNSRTANAAFTVSLSAPSGLPVSVSWATADGTALAGSDYTAASGTLTFAPPALPRRPSTVAVRGDTALRVRRGLQPWC